MASTQTPNSTSFAQRIPLAQKWFMLDPSNVAITSMALGIGVAGAAVIEVLWWVQGARYGRTTPLVKIAIEARE